MLSLYSGTPGSGKSLHMASRIANKLRAGRPVIANFEFNTSFIRRRRGREVPFFYVSNDDLSPDSLQRFAVGWWLEHSFHEDGILLVIDEAQLLFNAREWSKQGRSDWLSFFTQHRKFGYEIVLIAQFDRMIDRQIRSLIEYEFIHRKVSNYGLKGKLFAIWTLNKLFVAVKMWYPLGEKVGSEWFVARPRLYRLYDTYNKFQGGGAPSGTVDGGTTAACRLDRRRPDLTFTKKKEKMLSLSQTTAEPSTT